MTVFDICGCDWEPVWLLPTMLGVVIFLLLTLIVIMLWPIDGRVCVDRSDPFAEPFGDQPRTPS